MSSSSAAEAKRLPSVVACAGTLCERPTMTTASNSVARAANLEDVFVLLTGEEVE